MVTRTAKRTEPNNGDPETREILLTDIRIDKTQSRARIDDETVRDYAESMDDGVDFPPVIVFWDGKEYWLADGFHRLAAAQKREKKSIACEVRQGTMRDALKYSFQANAAHGLKRTNEDKRRAVELALADGEWQGWSSPMLAELCGVSEWLVDDVRKPLNKQVRESRTSEEPPAEKRKGRDGKLYRVKKRRLGKKNRGDTSPDPVTEAANGKEPSQNGAPAVSAKDVQHALNLLTELRSAMETLGLADRHSYSLEQMTVDVESLEGGDTNTTPNAPREAPCKPR